MKLNDPRRTLFAGLTLALSLNVSSPVRSADTASDGTLRLARAQLNGAPSPAPTAPVPGQPGLTPAPFVPPPTPPQDNFNLQPIPQLAPSTTAPAPLGSQPGLSPMARPPMGLLYGEQEKLEAQINPPPRPLSNHPYPGTPGSSQLPSGIGDGSPVQMMPPNAAPQLSGTDRFGFAPPPGTLGQTYKRRSRLIDDKKHPRVGIVEVNLPESVDVTSLGLKSKWTGKVWRLESDPLLPGVPHIYEIKASWGEGTEPQYRTVRLIMGRIVDLDF